MSLLLVTVNGDIQVSLLRRESDYLVDVQDSGGELHQQVFPFTPETNEAVCIAVLDYYRDLQAAIDTYVANPRDTDAILQLAKLIRFNPSQLTQETPNAITRH